MTTRQNVKRSEDIISFYQHGKKKWRLDLECGHSTTRILDASIPPPEQVACQLCERSSKPPKGGPVSHASLVGVAERWLRNTMKCGVVVCEGWSMTGEVPDAIGFKSQSYLIECKASLEDFRRDQRKRHRRPDGNGMGELRFYLAQAGIIPIADLPPKWGLLELDAGRVYVSRKATEIALDSVSFRMERDLLAAGVRHQIEDRELMKRLVAADTDALLEQNLGRLFRHDPDPAWWKFAYASLRDALTAQEPTLPIKKYRHDLKLKTLSRYNPFGKEPDHVGE